MTTASLSAIGEADEPARTVAGLADLASATLGVARALVGSNRVIDLRGLDSDIGMLCARVLDLPPEQGRPFRVRLIALLQELDALQAALPRPAPLPSVLTTGYVRR